MGRSICQALHTYPQSESSIAQGLFSQRATRVLQLRLFSSTVLTLHSPKAKSMSLARFSRHPGEASQEGMSKQDLSSNVFSGSPRRDRAQVTRRGQTPAKREATEKLRVTPNKLLPRTARTWVLGGRTRAGLQMHEVSVMTDYSTTLGTLDTALFPFPDLMHKQHARTQTNTTRTGIQVTPSPQLPAELRSSGVRAKLATCICTRAPWVGERPGRVTLGSPRR